MICSFDLCAPLINLQVGKASPQGTSSNSPLSLSQRSKISSSRPITWIRLFNSVLIFSASNLFCFSFSASQLSTNAFIFVCFSVCVLISCVMFEILFFAPSRFCFDSRKSFLTCSISIKSTGFDLILTVKSIISLSISSISFLIFEQKLLARIVSDSLEISFNSNSLISVLKSISSFCLMTAFNSSLSFLASLNLRSKRLRSRNFANISFLFVEPSLINIKEPSCEDIEVIKKSSSVPKYLTMFLSVSALVVPFSDSCSPVSIPTLEKSTMVFASTVSTFFSFFRYFSALLSIV